MCLGVPGRVVGIDNNNKTAQVDFWGVRRQILVNTVDEAVEIGDYVLVHVGFAIRKIPAQEVKSTLDFYESLLAAQQGDDLMKKDVQGEIDAAV